MFGKKNRPPLDFPQVVTRGGDQGSSGLYSGERYSKDDLYFECLGTIDELSSWLGVLQHHSASPQTLTQAQRTLQTLGSRVATLSEQALPALESAITELEATIAEVLKRTPIAPNFVLPGATPASAWADVARTVCRRAERVLVRLIQTKGRPDLADGQRFLNRLSDYLFVLARSLEA